MATVTYPAVLFCPGCTHQITRHCKSPNCNLYPCRRPTCRVTHRVVRPDQKIPNAWILANKKLELPEFTPPASSG